MNTTTTTNFKNFFTELTKIKSPKFVSFIYTTQTGETSKYLVSINAQLSRAKNRDIFILNKFVPENKLQETAKNELLKSLIAPNVVRSEAQKNAGIPVLENKLIYFPETGNLNIWGFLISKKTLVPGEDKTRNSSPIVAEKNKLKKQLNLASAKFRRFTLTQIKNFKINGQILEIIL